MDEVRIKIVRFSFSIDRFLSAILRETFSVIKLSVSIFRQITGYRIYTVGRIQNRLSEIQYPVLGIFKIIKNGVEKKKLEQIFSKSYSFLIQTLICIITFA